MTPKERITDRLRKTEVLQGVLPTPSVPSEELSTMVRQLRKNDIDGAVRSATDDLKRVQPDLASELAIRLFAGSPPLRQQIAGFAGAGISLFHASKSLVELPLAARGNRGANGMVSRVLVSEQRILLETPRVIVRFKQGMTAAQRTPILAKYHVVETSTYGLPPDTVIGAIVNGGEAVECSIALMGEPDVLYSEPDFIEHLGQRYTPTDPEFTSQWHHKTIQAESAWDTSKGEAISVVVIDNGFDIAHPDLQFGPLTGRFRPTPDHVDADFLPGTAGMNDQDHGTACAGMIAAKTGNGAGGCGVAFSSVLSMVACAPDQVGTQSTLARALAYAAAPDLEPGSGIPRSEGADIIACSLGPNSAKWEIRQVMADAIDFAATQGRGGKGCAIFWACTNGNFPIGSDEVCSHPHVIAVGRSRQTDSDDGSGFGPQLEFLAPDVQVRNPCQRGRLPIHHGYEFRCALRRRGRGASPVTASLADRRGTASVDAGYM